MSLTFALILTANAVTTPTTASDGQRWQRVATAAHEMGVPTPRLHDALASAAPSRRTARPLYCFDDRLTNPAAPTKRCRTRAEWAAFGLEPITEGSVAALAR